MQLEKDANTAKGVSRRNFLKSSAVTVAGVVGSGFLLTACGKGRKNGVAQDVEEGTKATMKAPNFLKAPEPIKDSEIKETLEADVIVVGAGMSGICAAAAAAEEGAKVIIIEKGPNINFRSYDYGAVNSKLQVQAGNSLDPKVVTREIMRWGAYKADQKVVKLFSEQSGKVNDWIVDNALKVGCKVKSVWTKEEQISPGATIPNIPTLSFVLEPPADAAEKTPKGMIGGNGVVAMAYTLKTTAEKLGVDFKFEMPAVQLVRKDNKDRVTGVIAKNKQDQYVKFNAKKAVILCAGDYGHDKEMLGYYIPTSEKIQKIMYPGTYNTGDGHKMGMWVGAGMDEGPHAPMYFDNALLDPDGKNAGRIDAMVRQPWLSVNLRGERYANEDLPFAYISNAVRQQAGNTRWTIWDDKYEDEAPRFKQSACKTLKFHHRKAELEDLVQKGIVVKADSIEELAQKMKVPVETLKVTVDRYNELAKKGDDEDFGKDKVYLTTVEKAPFYAGHIGTALLVTLGGLTINDKLQVLDTEKNVIPGLYAAGNNSGSFFATDYPIVVTGCSHGRAYTFGYLSGKNAVKLG
ncbi:FAD-dependent oxidoreductase [Anaerosinus massiliensis]|uniref:FAD-dependent oxidoreductase n=1 Tax=Massilibacillus massiliensis TaxID=1806837 RepID=UPI000B11D0E4|nr:FAD-dependent oxidoreductase [Massilibacillus massiliensis]